ncbi:MAG: methyl-accepting chemotaxis protein [Castellaniella sp.]|uniref:methyl-accepting chemotaxis protein n=1 Tax=Castellaniella sp. TaxID=1955812 RepID=UPI003C7347AD
MSMRICWMSGRVAQDIQSLDRQALDITISNAGMMSSFTNVITLSREQTGILASLRDSMDTLAHSVEAVVQSAEVTRDGVDNMHALAQRGDALLGETTARLGALARSADSLSDRFREVVRQTREIEGILGLIQQVAMQTNLLSLNAAVEAARAGEQGRGFGVVADEVRKLAARTDEATVQIRAMISAISASTAEAGGFLETVLTDIQAGVEHAREAGQALDDISQHSSRTLEASGQMTEAAHTQSGLSQEIGRDIASLSESARQSVEWVGKSNVDLRLVQGQIGTLKRGTAQLLPGRPELEVLSTCAEEMRACNILIKNADRYDEIQPVVERIGEVDQIMDATWARYRGRKPDSAAQERFAEALQAYRVIRSEILDLARRGQFDAVRDKITTQGRPAYGAIKQALTALEAGDAAKKRSGRRLLSLRGGATG